MACGFSHGYVIIRVMATDNYNELILRTDGGSRNNPGDAAIGFVIEDASGKVVETQKKYIGIATNNEAEYNALLSGLAHIVNFYKTCRQVHIYSDSELMIRQITGVYKIKEQHLKVLAESIKVQLAKFDAYKFTHVLREKNKLADKLVNEALDARLIQ